MGGDEEMEKRTTGVLPMTTEVKVLCSVDEAAAMLSLGRTLAWSLVRKNELRSVKVGRSRRVVVASLHEYVCRLMGQAG
jgi:excisionase family DNA binding protein